nr:hypothetical protein [Tanacetum cinerariifolium]
MQFPGYRSSFSRHCHSLASCCKHCYRGHNPARLRRQGKRKSVAVDAGGAFHPPKKMQEDHVTPSGTFIGSKSRSSLQMLLAEAMLNAKVGVTAIPTLPFVTAYVSTTSKREDEDHTDCVVEPNLRTIRALQRSSTPVMKTATTFTSTVDYTLVAKEKPVKPSLFVADSSSSGGADPNTGVFLDLTSNDFLVGGIRTQDRLLKARDGEIENLKAQLLLSEVEAVEAIRLRT